MPKMQQPAGVSYASCSVSAAPLRQAPSHRSEQTSQILFGERVEVLQHNPETDWAFVRMQWDGYEGWCKAGQLGAIGPKEFKKAGCTLNLTDNGLLITDQGTISIPAAGELTGMGKGQVPAGTTSGKFKGRKMAIARAVPDAAAIIATAIGFLQAPYHWGGRTRSGIDCSGLVQIAFKLSGIRVPRDASQQALIGEEVHFLAESKSGDLAFFDNEDGRIVHVGILAGPDEIIHATDTVGRVVRDRIDSAGIISRTLKRRTHKLRMIRRMLS